MKLLLVEHLSCTDSSECCVDVFGAVTIEAILKSEKRIEFIYSIARKSTVFPMIFFITTKNSYFPLLRLLVNNLKTKFWCVRCLEMMKFILRKYTVGMLGYRRRGERVLRWWFTVLTDGLELHLVAVLLKAFESGLSYSCLFTRKVVMGFQFLSQLFASF